ncbi:MAG: LysR family transcriptional regulator [Micrococcaceae bacterium]
MNDESGITEPPANSRDLASLDLNLLVPLQALLEEESVTRASERVGLSQPAMSHALKRLRRLFGDDLLVRRGGGSSLTSLGSSLIGPLRDIMLRTAMLIDGMDFQPGQDTRTVRVAMTSSTVAVIGNRLGEAMRRHAPRMRLHIQVAWESADEVFTRERADVLLLSRALETSYQREHLYDDDWMVMSGVDDLTEANVLERLSSRSHVMFDPGWNLLPYRVMHTKGIRPEIHLRVADSVVLPTLVEGRDVVAIHRRRAIEQLSEGTRIWAVPFPLDVGELGVDLVWNPWLSDVAFKEWFGGLLRRCAANS